MGFFLSGDNTLKGLYREGFQLTSSVETAGGGGGGFLQFLLPLPISTTAFRSTQITMIDDDGK